jgi:hypothetical protein
MPEGPGFVVHEVLRCESDSRMVRQCRSAGPPFPGGTVGGRVKEPNLSPPLAMLRKKTCVTGGATTGRASLFSPCSPQGAGRPSRQPS